MKNILLEQIHNAFERSSNLAGTIHGERKVREGQRGKSTSVFPSRKVGGAVVLESRLELAYALALERDPNVSQYRTNALKIQIDEKHHVIPDFLIKTSDDWFEVHEVKPSILDLKERDRLRYDRIEKILASHNIFFKIVDRHELMNKDQTNRLLHLYSRGHRYPWSTLQITTAMKILGKAKFKNLSYIHSLLAAEGIDVHIGEYLVFHGKVNIESETLWNWRS